MEKLRRHVQVGHNVELEVEEKTFTSLEEFKIWKRKLEEDVKCSYVLKQAPKTLASKAIVHYYSCFRSGSFVSKSTGQRRLKNVGSRKISGYCPSSIHVTVTEKDVKVKLWKTHFGHDIDVGHYLPFEERSEIACEVRIRKRLKRSAVKSVFLLPSSADYAEKILREKAAAEMRDDRLNKRRSAPVLEYPVHQNLNTTSMEKNLIDMANQIEETFENTELTTCFVQEDVEPNPNLSSFPSSVISTSDDSEISTGEEEANTQSAGLPEASNLQHELKHLNNPTCASDFKVENITDDYTMYTVTGFNVKAFHAMFKFLCLENLLQKNGFPLSPVDQFFLMVVYLKTGLNQLSLSFLYNISQLMVSRIFNNTGVIVHKQLKKFDIWPSREFVRDKTPSSFSKKFPNCRVIVDCVEFQIQNPTSEVTQEALNHKNFYSMKGLIGITPSGTVSFISKLLGGATTNKNLFLSSGLIDLLQPGDLVLADKGFNVESELAERGCILATPDFGNSDDIEEIAVASHYHGLVEKVVSRIRTYKYFNNQIINSDLHYSSNYFFIVAFFLNFANPLVLEDDG